MKKILLTVLLTLLMLLSSCDIEPEGSGTALEAAIEKYKDDQAIVGSIGQPGGPMPPGEPRVRVIELIKTLVSTGINTTDGDGFTALIYASQNRYTEIVAALIAEGADLNIKTTAPRETAGGTALIFAANNGHTAAVTALVEAGAVVNATNNNGFTALIYAASRLDIKAINTLIAANADVNAKITSPSLAGWTALIYSASRGHIVAVEALIEAGADVNVKVISFGRTITPLTVAGRNQDIVNLLKAAGATE